MQNNLAKILSTLNGASFVAVDTLTPVPLTGGKKNPMQGLVTKRVTGSSVMIFSNKKNSAYDLMVRRRLVAEGKDPDSFELQPRKWGERLPELPLVRHVKDGEEKFYMEVIFLKAGTVEYFLNGKPIAKEKIEGLKDVTESEQGGLDNKVIIRSYTVENIVAMRCDGAQYIGNFHVDLENVA